MRNEKKGTFEKVTEMVRESGISERDFSHKQFFFAWIYRQLLWHLFRKFINGRCRCGLKNSEYTTDGKGKMTELTLLVELDGKHVKLAAFCEFLMRNEGLVPIELRNMFSAAIGLKYGDAGAVVIDKDGVRMISQEKFMGEDTDACLTDEIKNPVVYEKLKDLRLLFDDFVAANILG